MPWPKISNRTRDRRQARHDKIEALMDRVYNEEPAHYQALMYNGGFAAIPSYVMDEGSTSDWYDSDDAASLIDDLEDILGCTDA